MKTEYERALLQYQQALQNFEHAEWDWIPIAIHDWISAERSLDNVIRDSRRPV